MRRQSNRFRFGDVCGASVVWVSWRVFFLFGEQQSVGMERVKISSPYGGLRPHLSVDSYLTNL